MRKCDILLCFPPVLIHCHTAHVITTGAIKARREVILNDRSRNIWVTMIDHVFPFTMNDEVIETSDTDERDALHTSDRIYWKHAIRRPLDSPRKRVKVCIISNPYFILFYLFIYSQLAVSLSLGCRSSKVYYTGRRVA